jgi:hypothetical protein
MLAALREKARTRDDGRDAKIEGLKAELERKSRIIAEVVDWNLALERALWGWTRRRGSVPRRRPSPGAGAGDTDAHRVDGALARSRADAIGASARRTCIRSSRTKWDTEKPFTPLWWQLFSLPSWPNA